MCSVVETHPVQTSGQHQGRGAHHHVAKPQSGTGIYHAKPWHSENMDVSRMYQFDNVARFVKLVTYSHIITVLHQPYLLPM